MCSGAFAIVLDVQCFEAATDTV